MPVKFTVAVTATNKYIKITDLLDVDKDGNFVSYVEDIDAGDDEDFSVQRDIDIPSIGHIWFDVARNAGHVPADGDYKRIEKYGYVEDGETYTIDDSYL